MPELPEVESTVRYLRERVEGLKIIDAHIGWQRTVATQTPSAFKQRMLGFSIDRVFRRGKFVGIESTQGRKQFLFIHLRMSGSLDVVRTDSPIAPHDRVILTLENGKSIRFNDTRKFGRMYLCDNALDIVGKLGVEPLEPSFNASTLYDLLHHRVTRIKPLLLDQTVIAGLGNIYVDESLWKAQIHPLTPAKRISRDRTQLLHRAITETLHEAVNLLGTDFGDGVVQDGMYSPVVYGREDSPCRRCGTMIKKTTVGQRGTHFCPTCQRRR
jgi:formamidopyrimidine-DNA glycosylase